MTRKSPILVSLLAMLPPVSGLAEVDFAHEVLPILKEHCAECHTNGKYKGGFSLDTRSAALESEAIVLGKSGESLMIELLTLDDPDERMPQKAEPLPKEKVATLAKWVDEGLPWEPEFTFRAKTWEAPLAPRLPELPAADFEGENPIDRIARAYLKDQDIERSEEISDSVFLRRIYLDLLGILPTNRELKRFLEDGAEDKRQRKVDELLSRNIDYADHWMSFWNDLLRNDYAGTGFIDGGRRQITGWLYSSLLQNKPYDQFVRELLSPNGDSEGFINGIKWRGNVNASQVREVQYAQNISQVFFGENLKCASCHDSFINDWKLDDAYGLAAVIADKPLELHRCDKPTGEMAKAKFLFPELGEIDPNAPKAERLKRVAELSTSRENGRLARTVVNRLWVQLMGRGLVEPVDVMSNRPWSEDMLDYLAWDLAENGYDLKHTLKLIANSRTYQSAVVAPPAEAEEYVFKGPIAKRMTAEQFIDAVWGITGTGPNKMNAQVQRGVDPTSPSGGVAPGKWIWTGGGNRPAGEVVTFTREFELPEKFTEAAALITCDNEYSLAINGKPAGSDDGWEIVERVDIAKFLKPGANSIQVVAKNGGSSPNPAALFVSIHVSTATDPVLIFTDEKWRANGKAAVAISGPWAAAVQSQIEGLNSADPAGSPPPIRASLVNSTLLMRALGRPNREQVVTSRPADLTTLQALELNNGEEFVGYLNRGADSFYNRLSNDPDELITTLYLTAVQRPPSDMERDVGRQMLGNPTTREGTADLLWTVLMLPEFQFIR